MGDPSGISREAVVESPKIRTYCWAMRRGAVYEGNVGC